MFDFNQFLSVPLLMMYAETHFRFFPLFPSFLYKKEPEILFDTPAYLKPGTDLPVALIINDLETFAVNPIDVSITLSQCGQTPLLFHFDNLNDYEIDHPFKNNMRVFVFFIKRQEIPDGDIFINCRLSMSKPGKKNIGIVLNDNLRTSSKLPLKCHVGSCCLPGSSLCSYGDFHVHSAFSRSQVEFGPPLQLIDLFASSMDLSFVGITDHSYDLACSKNNYLVQDKSLEQWKRLSNEFEGEKFKTILLQGEEISCLNGKNNVVHLCGLGLSKFIAGTLDGARKNIVFNKQLTINQAIDEIHNQSGIAFAAHPGSNPGVFQLLFLHRGTWAQNDITKNLDGFQGLNSGFDSSWHNAKSLWIKSLQSGLRLPLLGGNDAHGDFNRYRAISIPFVNVYENFERFMGAGKTGIYGKIKSQSDILNRIRNGATFVTTGPYISINYTENPNSCAISTTNIMSSFETLCVHAVSSCDMGALQQIRIYSGTYESDNEKLLLSINCPKDCYEISKTFDIKNIAKPAYIRAEVQTVFHETTSQAYTSACYIE